MTSGHPSRAMSRSGRLPRTVRRCRLGSSGPTRGYGRTDDHGPALFLNLPGSDMFRDCVSSVSSSRARWMLLRLSDPWTGGLPRRLTSCQATGCDPHREFASRPSRDDGSRTGHAYSLADRDAASLADRDAALPGQAKSWPSPRPGLRASGPGAGGGCRSVLTVNGRDVLVFCFIRKYYQPDGASPAVVAADHGPTKAPPFTSRIAPDR
jgi:hypothetical protein